MGEAHLFMPARQQSRQHRRLGSSSTGIYDFVFSQLVVRFFNSSKQNYISTLLNTPVSLI